jgi:hypothetical protein
MSLTAAAIDCSDRSRNRARNEQCDFDALFRTDNEHFTRVRQTRVERRLADTGSVHSCLCSRAALPYS